MICRQYQPLPATISRHTQNLPYPHFCKAYTVLHPLAGKQAVLLYCKRRRDGKAAHEKISFPFLSLIH